jgi:hypothetical protein
MDSGHRHSFHNSSTSIGSAIHLAGALAPLRIHELVDDPKKKRHCIRIAAAATAIASGVLWRDRVQKSRETDG